MNKSIGLRNFANKLIKPETFMNKSIGMKTFMKKINQFEWVQVAPLWILIPISSKIVIEFIYLYRVIDKQEFLHKYITLL